MRQKKKTEDYVSQHMRCEIILILIKDQRHLYNWSSLQISLTKSN